MERILKLCYGKTEKSDKDIVHEVRCTRLDEHHDNSPI